jgi:hypothetical protein
MEGVHGTFARQRHPAVDRMIHERVVHVGLEPRSKELITEDQGYEHGQTMCNGGCWCGESVSVLPTVGQ